MWTIVSSVDCELCSAGSFLNAIEVLVNRPHISNDRIFGGQVTAEVSLEQLFYSDKYSNVNAILTSLDKSKDVSLNSLLPCASTSPSCLSTIARSVTVGLYAFQRTLYPKVPDKYPSFKDIILLDINENISVAFIAIQCQSSLEDKCVAPTFPYIITYKEKEKEITLEVLESESSNPASKSSSYQWLLENVLKRVVKWSSQDMSVVTSVPSLSLVPIDKYYYNRHRLKTKYAKDIVERWTESTDPMKFVHEDIAIAAYLLTIWECEREELGLEKEKKQSFVDLGCGNGLLVYILSSEGHQGLGIDLRKRAIWDNFCSVATLVESSLDPSRMALFPNYDWLIGNHSDELTPWIPVIASRSSYMMRVFLLPCCAFTFDGKYQRTFPGSSQYQSYLNFVQDLCQEAGFVTQRDKLRIPSTKRICFVCTSRVYPDNEEEKWEENRKSYIIRHSRNSGKNNEDRANEPQELCFKPREKIEPVRNCTQLDKGFLDKTVTQLAYMLLSAGNGTREIKTKTGVKSFPYGGHQTIQELAERLDSDVKQQLKQQCGGLQTLLRNHRHIFQISENKVCLTTPLSISEYNSMTKNPGKNRRRTKNPMARPCWFHFHHPQGCPLEQDTCRFLHSSIDS